jgi:hypothetical protein
MPVVLPPPATPRPTMPERGASTPPAEANKAAVSLVADEPSLVEEITGHYEGIDSQGFGIDGSTYATLCPATPCVVNLGFGDHQLRITSLVDPHDAGTDTLTVPPHPIDYRMNLGHSTDPRFAWILPLTLGGMSLSAGIVFTALGDVKGFDNKGMETSTNVRPVGIGMMIGGAALTAFALWLWHHESGTQQPASALVWTPGG